MDTIYRHFFISMLVALIIPDDWCYGAKILAIFPLPYRSHFNCNNAVARSLRKAGHEVTMITSFPQMVAADNYTRVIDMSKETLIYVGESSYDEFRKLTPGNIIATTVAMEKPFCNKVFRMKEYQEMFNSEEKYDAVLVEILYLYKCLLPIAAKHNIPVIGVTTVKSWYYADRATNNVYHPADVPFQFINSWKFDSIYHRFVNTWSYLVAALMWHSSIATVLREFYRENEHQLKSYSDFLNIEPSLMFYNSHHAYLPRPMNPNVIEIGGLQVPLAKPLTKDIEKFIEEASHGVILFSFGSFIKTSTIPSRQIEMFKNVFAKIPQRVIWKFEDEMKNVPSNILIMKWTPQRDILEHPNVKAFISHGGQGGIYEAIQTATPIIAVPFGFDQPANSVILENLGVAVRLDFDSFTEDDVLSAVNAIINDTKYYDNMQKLSKTFNDRPMTPEQNVVYWTEYVIRHHGAPNFKTASSQLNWFQYFLLDILCLVIISVIVAIYILFWLVKSVIIYKNKIQCYLNHKNKSN